MYMFHNRAKVKQPQGGLATRILSRHSAWLAVVSEMTVIACIFPCYWKLQISGLILVALELVSWKSGQKNQHVSKRAWGQTCFLQKWNSSIWYHFICAQFLLQDEDCYPIFSFRSGGVRTSPLWGSMAWCTDGRSMEVSIYACPYSNSR